MNDEKLERCPHCGSDNVSVMGTCATYVICKDCEASTGLYSDRAEAIRNWNRRYYP